MLRRLLFLAAVVFLSGGAGAAGVADDASCDVALLPAATLLLPYFEVDIEDSLGENTLFTISTIKHEGRTSTSVDAAALGSLSEVTNGNVIIGPATRTKKP